MKFSSLVFVLILLLVETKAHAESYEIGTGIYDITGPVAGVNLIGHNAGLAAEGIHQRLFARAFVIRQPEDGKRVAFVSIDLLFVTPAVKLEVSKRLAEEYGQSSYSNENVMISATHTHHGPGGISHHTLFNGQSSFVYSPQTFEAVVGGIVKAVKRAHRNLEPGSISLKRGKLYAANRNRSLEAHLQNVDANPSQTTNLDMTLLKFVKNSGQEIGLINWFSVHNTSFSNLYKLVNGDAKNYAGYMTEKAMGGNHLQQQSFVAAFASSDQGDVVSFDGNANSKPGFGGSDDELVNVQASAFKQYNMSNILYEKPGKTLQEGRLDFRHKWVYFPGYKVEEEYTADGVGDAELCIPAIGNSALAGGENGPPDPGSAAENTLEGLLAQDPDDTTPCQFPKPIIGISLPETFVPYVVPVQLFIIDSLAIIAIPGELTTMAGRRIRARVLSSLAPKGVQYAVIAGLANSYQGYISTYEEFNAQHYEGASTHFGPHSTAAFIQLYDELATAIAQDKPVISKSNPEYEPWFFHLPELGVLFDRKPAAEDFGFVLTDVSSAPYKVGSSVQVRFRSGHPKNNLQTQDSFLRVQKKGSDGLWETIAYDWDWETTYRWSKTRDCLGCSVAEITWNIPQGTPQGIYRIVHDGHWKPLFGPVHPYRGTSQEFVVSAASPATSLKEAQPARKLQAE